MANEMHLAVNGGGVVYWEILGPNSPNISEISFTGSDPALVIAAFHPRHATVTSAQAGNFAMRVAVDRLGLADTATIKVEVPVVVGIPANTAYTIENQSVTFMLAGASGHELQDTTLNVTSTAVGVTPYGDHTFTFAAPTVGQYPVTLTAASLGAPVPQMLHVVDRIDAVEATTNSPNSVCFKGIIGTTTTVVGVPWIVSAASATGSSALDELGNGCYRFDTAAVNLVVSAGYHGVSGAIIINRQP